MKTMKAPSARVLIVDDNIPFSENIADILNVKGFETICVHDGPRAVEAVKENGFDLILMDIRMPTMNGVETLKRIQEIAPATPVIMMTAYAVEDLIREALQEGAFGVLRKPLDIEKLISTIEVGFPDGGLIMVVDDDEALCASLHDVLEEKGYRTRTARNGETAIEMARECDFDIILLDMKLPGLNGLEVYLAIRDVRPNAVMIMITGYPQNGEGLARRAVEEGAYICLEKPLDVDHLLNVLDEVVVLRGGRKRERR